MNKGKAECEQSEIARGKTAAEARTLYGAKVRKLGYPFKVVAERTVNCRGETTKHKTL